MEHSAGRTVAFTTVLCVVFAVLVSSVAVSLKDRQDENKRLDKIKNVLRVAGLMTADESLEPDEINRRFEQSLEAHVIDLSSGELMDGMSPLDFDQRKAAKDPDRSRPAPTNLAKVRRVPNNALVYLIRDEGEVQGIVIPVEGYGLWGTLYGYLALEEDTRTVLGITFYEHKETPGLGGEVDNPRWKGLFPGRLAFDENWEPQLRLKKGSAGSVEDDPYQVDGLSGATITSNGVTNMIKFWLGEDGFGPYLKKYRQLQEMG